MICLVLATLLLDGSAHRTDPGPFVDALWLVQRFGTAKALDPSNDERTKAALSKALGKDGVVIKGEVEGLFAPETFESLAGPDGRLTTERIRTIVESNIPDSRAQLLPRVRSHADSLTTSFDLINESHRRSGGELVDWIAAKYRPGAPLDVTVVCTGNSRRSILGATMGNIAAAYYGMPEVRFHSGGTAPTAFNPRTIACLREIGVEVEATGREAARGEPTTANPVCHLRWGTGPAGHASEFSKVYSDPSNPQAGFAALMVCSEADAGCPVVKGASVRISMPYLDPKLFDGSPFETAKYAERRDDIGRLMLSVMMRASQRVALGNGR